MVHAIAHQHDAQLAGVAQLPVELDERVAAAPAVVDRLGGRRAQEPVRLERRPEQVIRQPPPAPAEIGQHAPPSGLAAAERG